MADDAGPVSVVDTRSDDALTYRVGSERYEDFEAFDKAVAAWAKERAENPSHAVLYAPAEVNVGRIINTINALARPGIRGVELRVSREALELDAARPFIDFPRSVAGPDPAEPPQMPLRTAINVHDERGVTYQIVGHRHEAASAAELYAELRALQYHPRLNPAGAYEADSPVIVKPHDDAPWRHLVDVVRQARRAKFVTVLLAQSAEASLKPQQVEIQSVQRVRDPAAIADHNAIVPRANFNSRLVGVAGEGVAWPFGAAPGDKSNLHFELFDVQAKVRKAIYIIDASPTLKDQWPAIIKEVQRSLRDLHDRHTFTVMFAKPNAPFEVPPRGWKQADDRMAELVGKWIDPEAGNVVVGDEPTDPVMSFKLASRYKPYAIFFVSDQVLSDEDAKAKRDRILKEITDANESLKAPIHCIQIGEGENGVLREIAEEHGGVFKVVKREELRKE